MNNQLQQALAAMLNKTVGAVGVGVDFLSSELPEVIRQLLVWKAVESGMFFIIFLSLAIFMSYWFRKMLKGPWMTDERFPEPTKAGVCGVLSLLFMILFSVLTIASVEWLQILIAPKIYLIEYVAHLAKH